MSNIIYAYTSKIDSVLKIYENFINRIKSHYKKNIIGPLTTTLKEELKNFEGKNGICLDDANNYQIYIKFDVIINYIELLMNKHDDDEYLLMYYNSNNLYGNNTISIVTYKQNNIIMNDFYNDEHKYVNYCISLYNSPYNIIENILKNKKNMKNLCIKYMETLIYLINDKTNTIYFINKNKIQNNPNNYDLIKLSAENVNKISSKYDIKMLNYINGKELIVPKENDIIIIKIDEQKYENFYEKNIMIYVPILPFNWLISYYDNKILGINIAVSTFSKGIIRICININNVTYFSNVKINSYNDFKKLLNEKLSRGEKFIKDNFDITIDLTPMHI